MIADSLPGIQFGAIHNEFYQCPSIFGKAQVSRLKCVEKKTMFIFGSLFLEANWIVPF
jgi:hypothetical protein